MQIGNATHLLLFVLESREWHPLLLDFMYQVSRGTGMQWRARCRPFAYGR